jgi:hypothetical protein
VEPVLVQGRMLFLKPGAARAEHDRQVIVPAACSSS